MIATDMSESRGRGMKQRAHVLVVDDDARIRALLQKFLARNGFWVTGARDAAHARRLNPRAARSIAPP